LVLEDTDVSPQGDLEDAAPKSGQEAGGGKGKEKDPTADLQKEIETLRTTNRQLTESERYWSERARANGRGEEDGAEDVDDAAKPKKGAAEPEDEVDEDPSKFVDDLSASGIKALEKRGLITKKQATAMIEDIAEKVAERVANKVVKGARTAMTHDAELIQQYPELNDPESDLFKETSTIYQAAVKKDPSLKKSTVALMQAAEVASLRIKVRDGAGRRQERDDDADRTRRIREQAGDRSRRGGFEDEDADDSMGPEARHIAQMLGVKEADYKNERTKLKGGRR
jgi:hypothetical protein